MKSLLIFTSIFTTGGFATTAALKNSSKFESTNFNALAKKDEEKNISVKNILQIQKDIEKSKTENKIDDLNREKLDLITASRLTTLQINFSSEININNTMEKYYIENNSKNLNNLQQELGNLLHEKIKLEKANKTYEKIQNHFNSTPIQKSQWQIIEDKSLDSGCKLEKINGSTAAGTTTTCYDWQIILMTTNEKIKSLISSDNNLLNEFNQNTKDV